MKNLIKFINGDTFIFILSFIIVVTCIAGVLSILEPRQIF